MRELRVEDALLYLDQVKVEFGDRPHIYNEFLDIMKTFKTQQIDTPGVIRRVSNLFQGNRRLVLGFNTFLPDGYKIEIPKDGDGPPVAVYRAPGSNEVHVLRESAESQAVTIARHPPVAATTTTTTATHGDILPRGLAAGGGEPYAQQQQQQQQQQQLSPNNSFGGAAATAAANAGNPPSPHARATAKAMLPPDAGGVAPRPPIRPDQQVRQQPPPQQQQQLPGGVAPRQQQPASQGRKQAGRIYAAPEIPVKSAPPLNQQQQQQQPPQQPPAAAAGAAAGAQAFNPPLEFDHAINYVTTIKRRFAAEPETYKRFLEILHTYQKEQRGIKEVLDEVSELFDEHPDLLKEFTYFLPDAVQAQAKMQLDQVAKEAEARQRSKAKAAIMNTAQGMQRQAINMRQAAAMTNQKPAHEIHNDKMATPSGGAAYPPTPRSSSERENNISRGAQYGAVMFDPVRPPRKNELTPAAAALKKGRPTAVPELPKHPNTTEAAFFQRAKDHLNRKELAADKPTGRLRNTPYTEFLKCLHLFGAGILNKEELCVMLKGLFTQGHAPRSGANAGGGSQNPVIATEAAELLREFEELIINRGPYARQQALLKDKSKYGSLRTCDFDFTGCKQPTPSYRTYPSDYPRSLFISNPGQNQIEGLLLNNDVVCVDPMVDENDAAQELCIERKRKAPSMEESDGSRKRHNSYEEMLFRIEDERYELDMAIERNVHALRRIEPFAKEVEAFREQEEADGQPIGRLRYQLHRYSLNTIHINAIGRIYGERGDEVLQHLIRNPLVVLPIVYQRLKQKDAEWRKAQTELAEKWNTITEANYEGSMDVRCYYNRKALEKSFSTHRLLDQCKRTRSYIKHPEKLKDHPASHVFAPKFKKRAVDPGAVLYQPFVEFDCQVDISHKYAFQLMAHRLKALVTQFERERIGRIWAEFVVPWFGYPSNWVLEEVRESFGGVLSPSVAKFTAGQRVVTIFGEGTIASFMEATQNSGPKYRVRLPFGLGQLTPSAILYSVAVKDNPHIRRDGIMIRDESPLETEEISSKLGKKYKLLFGTEKIYLFARLYTLLCSVLSDTQDFCQMHPTTADPADLYIAPSRKQKSSGKLDFSSVLIALKKLLANNITDREYEALARKVCRDKVHQFAALPKLIERCADVLRKVAEEDALLHLYDYCKYSDVDPVVVRTHCLSIVPDAFYRIQFEPSAGVICYNYQESGALLTAPPHDEEEEDVNMDTGDDADAMDEDPRDEFGEHQQQNGEFREPEAKRMRVD